jgi:hypothetical protein
MKKTYAQMTPAERLSDRIAKNREIDERVKNAPPVTKKSAKGNRQIGGSDVLDEFQRIKRQEGIDAASEFLEKRRPSDEPQA